MKKIRDYFRPLFRIVIRPYTKYNCMRTERKLLTFKDKYKGRRCFIVANGPSLRISDLEQIKANKDISFGMNRIYVLFDKTSWRPDFYLVQDPTIVRACNKEIEKNLRETQIFMKLSGEPWNKIPNAIFYDLNHLYVDRNIKPTFGDGKNGCFIDGKTVTYTAMQLAVYMGFSEIYLLGCDSNYSKDNKVINTASYPDERMYDSKKVGMNPDMEYNFMAYQAAKEYLEGCDSKIYNATRGGMLEIFERVDIDLVLNSEERG